MILFFPLYSTSQSLSTYSFNDLYDFDENTIYSILQTDDGFVWFGTDNGLYKFDGSEFEHYSFVGYDNEYSNLKLDSYSKIWFSNFGGQLFCFHNNTIQLVVEQTPNNNYISEYYLAGENSIYYHTAKGSNLIFSDLEGNQKEIAVTEDSLKVSASTNNENGITLFCDKIVGDKRFVNVCDFDFSTQLFSCSDSLELSTTSSKVFGLTLSKEKQLYIEHNKEFDLVLFSNSNMPLKLSSKEINSEKMNGYKVLNGELILLGVNESYKINILNDGYITFSKLCDVKNASNILEDQEGNLWITTLNNGVFIAPNKQLRTFLISPYEEIRQVNQLNKNDNFFVTDEGKFYQFDFATKTTDLILEDNFSPNFSIGVNQNTREIVFPGSQYYYNVDDRKWLFKEERNFFKDIHFIGKDNAIITASSTYFISYKNETDSIKNEYQFEILDFTDRKDYFQFKIADGRANIIEEEASKGYLYVNQINGVVLYSKTEKPRFLSYLDKPIIASAMQKGETGIWIADISGYLHFVEKGKVLKSIPVNAPVENISVSDSLVFLQSDNLILRINIQTEIVDEINQTDGLIAEKLVDIFTTDSSVIVWGNHSIQEIPFTYSYFNKTPPKLWLNSILVNKNEVNEKTNFNFDYDQNNLEFYFKAFSIKSQKQILYYYRIKELSEFWNVTSFEAPYAQYSQLAPGSYTFQVKASNADGVFSEIINIPIIIDEHFTSKWWFVLLIFVLVVATIIVIANSRIKTLKRKAKFAHEKEVLQKDVYKAKVAAIRAQMNPHFIFNSLNSIQTLVLRGDIENSYSYINKFAALIRKTLDFSDQDYVPVSEEINLLENYLNLEKLRFRDDFDYEIIQKDIPDILVPPMLIQPFIENALKHGLLHMPTNRKLQLKFYFDTTLVCEVEDNGIGRKASAEINKRRDDSHKSFAMIAMKERFEILQQKEEYKVGFEFVDLEENGKATGTKVVIRLPFKFNL